VIESRPARERQQLPPFELVYEVHGPRIHSWLITRVGPDRADDVLQETMLAALRVWGRTRVDSVPAWLFTIAANKATDEDRREKKLPQPDGEAADWPAPPVATALEDPVWDEVRALPQKQKVAVTLRFRGDLTHREVGLVMGITEAAARRNVFEGLRNLRERINLA